MAADSSMSEKRQEVWYAVVDDVKVTKEKSPLSEVVATLKKGKSVNVLESSSRHVRVQVRGTKIGWVVKTKLSPKKPVRPASGGLRQVRVKGRQTIAPKETRSQGSIRG